MVYFSFIFLFVFSIICIYVYKRSSNMDDVIAINMFEQPVFTFLNYDKYYNIFVAVGFIIAFAVRIYGFGSIPEYFNQDGALAAIDAKSLLNYGVDHTGMSWPVHLTGWDSAQMSSLMTYLQIFTVKLFGLSVLGVRLPSLIFSLLGIICLYKFAEKAFNKYFGLLVLYFAAINPWHIMQSRWALEANLYPHFIIIGLYLLYSAVDIKNTDKLLKVKKYGYLVASMIVFGLSMYAYGISIYTTPTLLAFLSIYLLYNRYLNMCDVLLCVFVYFLVAGFFILTMMINCFGWDTIQIGYFTLPYFENSSRAADVLLFSDSFGEDLILNTIGIFLVYVLQYDMHEYNAIAGFGVVYLFTLPFIIIGFIYVCSKFKKHIGLSFIFGLFLASSVCSVLTSMVNINRANIVHYGSILTACLGIYVVCYVCKYKFVNSFVFSTYLVAFVAFLLVYFISYPGLVNKLFYKDIADPLKYIYDLDSDQDYYISTITNDSIYQKYLTVSEVYTMFYHDLDSEYTRNITFDDTGQYYKDRYHYFAIGSLTKDTIQPGVYMVFAEDIDAFYESDLDFNVVEFDKAYVVVVN